MEQELLPEIYNIEAEQGVLGFLLDHPDDFYRVSGILNPCHFYEPVHQRIFQAIASAYEIGKPATVLTLKAAFDTEPVLSDMGGGKYLARLVTSALGVLNVAQLAEVLVDDYNRRLMQDLHHALHDLLQASNVTEAWSEIQHRAQDVLEKRNSNSVINAQKVKDNILNEMGKEEVFYTTGLSSLDFAMGGGIFQGRSYCFPGEPKSGKTLFAATMSHTLGKRGIPHLFVAAEMGSREIHQRNIASDLNESPMSFVHKRNDKSFIDKIAGYSIPSSVLYYDAPRVTFSSLKTQVQTAIHKHRIKGFVLDYLQLVTGAPKGVSNAEWQCEVAQWIAEVCKKENIFCIYTAQLNREGKVRGSDGAYQAADQIYHIHREDEENTAVWLELTHSRYTPRCAIGGKDYSPLHISEKGTHIIDWGTNTTQKT